MKRIGLFVALALIVTIGGTYAAWTYTKAEVGAVSDVNAELNVTLIEAQTETVNKGTITIVENTLAISIDDDGNHNAKLTITGQLIISFTGSNTSGNTVKGLNLQCNAKDNCGTYNGNDVFAYTTLNANREVGSGTDQSQAYAQWVITAEDAAKMIGLNGTITAESMDQYNALKTAINGKTITITVGAVK